MHFSRLLLASLLASVAIARAVPGGVGVGAAGEAESGASSESTGSRTGEQGEGRTGRVGGSESGSESSTGVSNANDVNPGIGEVSEARQQGVCKRGGGCGQAGTEAQPGSHNEASSGERQSEPGTHQPAGQQDQAREFVDGINPVKQPAQALAKRHMEDKYADVPAQPLEEANYAFGTKWEMKERDFFVFKNMQKQMSESQSLKTLPLDADSFVPFAVTNKNSNDKILAANVDSRNGHFQVEESYTGRDITKDLHFSEILGQAMSSKMDGGYKNVRVVTRYNIANEKTQTDIDNILKNSYYKAITPKDNPEEWNTLANGPNGAALFRFANDHFKTNNGWQPTKVHIYHREEPEAEGGGEASSENLPDSLPQMMWEYGSSE